MYTEYIIIFHKPRLIYPGGRISDMRTPRLNFHHDGTTGDQGERSV